MKQCFDCCSCNDSYTNLSKILKNELRQKIDLEVLFKSDIGWFQDKTIMENELNEWGLANKTGIYFMWHKDDYCSTHEKFHMKCLYIGKGSLKKRLINHYNSKDFSDEMLIYFSFFEAENRLVKYLEQLLLDIYNIPRNRSENPGINSLCQHFTQFEVD